MSNDDQNIFRIAFLIDKKFREELTILEEIELDKWLNESDSNRALFYQLGDPEFRRKTLAQMQQYREDEVLERILSANNSSETPGVRFGAILGRVAAAILLLLAIAAGFYFYIQQGKQPLEKNIASNDIGPGGNRATLTLADGRKLDLTKSRDGKLTEQAGSIITKLRDGQIAYQANGTTANKERIVFNTINTPNAGQYQIVLPDGSRVWLNAASSLKFPTRFNGAERRVELSGEGFFEIAKNKGQPFIVASGKQEVKVTGTVFNISAYQDEPTISTTLVEGSVKVFNVSSQDSVNLEPGKQANLVGDEFLVKAVEVENFTAWKEGLLVLQEVSLPTVLRQIERWYDVEFVFKDEPPAGVNLNGKVMRNTNLSGILNALEISTGMKFIIEGRRVIVEK